ncbi:uncharacterized protein METZ01_LOCUS426257, partial [marine metagenome]
MNGGVGLTLTSGDGFAAPVMVFTGTLTNINTALNFMIFNHTPAFNGVASVQIRTDDQGNTGSGGAQTDDDTIPITVIASHVSPNPIAFGNVPVSVGSVLKVTVSNTDVSTLTITNIVSDDAQFVPSTTSLSVAGGATGIFDVTLTPTSGGNQSGTLTITSNDPVLSPANIGMTGFGTIRVLNPEMGFGTVDLLVALHLQTAILNQTGAPVNITSIASSNGQFINLTPLPVAIADTESEVITIEFLPTSTGPFSATLTISYNPDVVIYLT